MLSCHAVTKEHSWGKVIVPLIWNRVVHPMWHFFSGILAWLLIQLLLSTHGMQQQGGNTYPAVVWYTTCCVCEPHSQDPSVACLISLVRASMYVRVQRMLRLFQTRGQCHFTHLFLGQGTHSNLAMSGRKSTRGASSKTTAAAAVIRLFV
jgi:hypothetical protein